MLSDLKLLEYVYTLIKEKKCCFVYFWCLEQAFKLIWWLLLVGVFDLQIITLIILVPMMPVYSK